MLTSTTPIVTVTSKTTFLHTETPKQHRYKHVPTFFCTAIHSMLPHARKSKTSTQLNESSSGQADYSTRIPRPVAVPTPLASTGVVASWYIARAAVEAPCFYKRWVLCIHTDAEHGRGHRTVQLRARERGERNGREGITFNPRHTKSIVELANKQNQARPIRAR